MKTPNIERNKLDYILTDLLPVEITELFSLNHFYNYLMDNRHVLDEAEKVIRKTIEEGNKLPFEKGWATMPLKFNILKGNDGQREISLMQPLSMINIYKTYYRILLFDKEVFQILSSIHQLFVFLIKKITQRPQQGILTVEIMIE